MSCLPPVRSAGWSDRLESLVGAGPPWCVVETWVATWMFSEDATGGGSAGGAEPKPSATSSKEEGLAPWDPDDASRLESTSSSAESSMVGQALRARSVAWGKLLIMLPERAQEPDD